MSVPASTSKSSVSYTFHGMHDLLSSSPVTITDQHDGRSFVAWATVNDLQFLKERERDITEPVIDLLNLGTAIFIADRLTPRSMYPSRITVNLPVHLLARFQSQAVQKRLADLLNWYTGDEWIFHFTQAQSVRSSAVPRHLLRIQQEAASLEIALFSDGLDALAGLANRILREEADQFLLLGTGANSSVQRLQQHTIAALQGQLPHARLDLTQINISLSGKGLKRNKLMRTRGLVFMLHGAAFATLEKKTELKLYENGVGAFNLAFRASELGIDHARSIHPLSLMWLSELASEILGYEFRVENPFLFQTKAEMCRVFSDRRLLGLPAYTFSCDSPLRDDAKQCGRCSSCVLRRQSLAASGIEDVANYALLSRAYHENIAQLKRHHLPAMEYQVDNFRRILTKPDPWNVFCRENPSLLFDPMVHATAFLGCSASVFREQILDLYRRYVHEWDQTSVDQQFQQDRVLLSALPHAN